MDDIERYSDKEKRAAYLKAYRADPKNQERKRAYMRERYKDAFWKEYMKEQSAAALAKKKAALQPLLDEARAGGCTSCPETDLRCLQFHHRDPATKKFTIGRYLTHLRLGPDPGYEKYKVALLEEIAKCDVLCANCHWKIHGS